MRKKIIRILLLCFIYLLLISSVYAQEIVSANQKNFLWKVQSNTNTVYILGSIHFLKEDMYPLNKRIEDAFNKSDILVVEVNINEADLSKLQKLMIESALYKEHVSRETYELAKANLQEFGIHIDQFSKFKPWFLALTITTLELQKLGFDPNYGIDIHFLKKAKDAKRVLELETADYQINLFNKFSDYEQELFLFYTLIDLNILNKLMDKLVSSWVKGDAKAIESISVEGLLEHPELLPIYEKLFYERNRNMFSRIEKFLKTKETYFIVVGAGHLVGEKGIIELLRKKRYLVEQL